MTAEGLAAPGFARDVMQPLSGLAVETWAEFSSRLPSVPVRLHLRVLAARRGGGVLGVSLGGSSRAGGGVPARLLLVAPLSGGTDARPLA